MGEYRKVLKMIALISQIGITMLSSIFICGLIGYFIDHRFGTHIFLVALILGIAGGYRAVYALIKQFISTKDKGSTDEKEKDLLSDGDDFSDTSQKELHEAEGGPKK